MIAKSVKKYILIGIILLLCGCSYEEKAMVESNNVSIVDNKKMEKQSEIACEEVIDTSSSELEEIIKQKFTNSRIESGEKWAVSVYGISNPDFKVDVNSGEKFQAASVIKVFILAAYLEYNGEILTQDNYEIHNLMETMITISENDSANRITELLGDGFFSTGAVRVNQWCHENGYYETHLGRKFMEENPTDDNYTSSRDCANILISIYNKECVSVDASNLIFTYLSEQVYKQKIPEKLPENVITANKTGGMPEGYGLGCIENDMAIVQCVDDVYAISVLSNELQGKNDEAVGIIQDISLSVYNFLTVPKKEDLEKIIMIDPGHSRIDTDNMEPIGPGADIYKSADTYGTQGIVTGVPEYELNLQISVALKTELKERGYKVYMTRNSNDVELTNIKRAKMANDLSADALIRIHANGSEDSSAEGAMTICITSSNPYAPELYEISRKLSDCIINAICESTNAENNGVWETDSMTGNNWSQVPTTIVEIGYMTNPDEDKKLNTREYQELIVQGIANGLDDFFLFKDYLL